MRLWTIHSTGTPLERHLGLVEVVMAPFHPPKAPLKRERCSLRVREPVSAAVSAAYPHTSL